MKCTLLCAALALATAQNFPEAAISSKVMLARVYLPDAETGYYRGTRFDWSGAISSLEWQGHSVFGKWFERYDPKLHDAITGPVEEFSTIGYDAAAEGGRFLKPGVGMLVKPREARYQQFGYYQIANGGEWKTGRGANWLRFEQRLSDASGYGYIYRKTLRLDKDRPRFVLEHSLRNTGTQTLETSVYQHNFYMLDAQPAGPGFSIKFPFDVRAARNLNGLAEARGRFIVFLKELAPGQSVYTELEGFGATRDDHDIRVENATTGLGIRQTCDRPISRLVLWSIRSTVCPEAYIQLKAEPGREEKWRITYDLYKR